MNGWPIIPKNTARFSTDGKPLTNVLSFLFLTNFLTKKIGMPPFELNVSSTTEIKKRVPVEAASVSFRLVETFKRELRAII
jgi:hypothetical protein